MADQGPNKLVTEFITTADPKGAQQAAESIKEVKKAAQETVPVQDELKKKTEQAAEADRESNKEKKNLLDSLRVLRGEFPLLGRAIDAVRNPVTLLAIGVGAVVSWFRQLTSATDALELRMAAFDKITAKMGSMAQLASQMQSDLNAFEKGLNGIAAQAEVAATALDKVNKEIDRQRRLEEFQGEAQLEEDLEKIDGSKLPESQKIRAREAAKQRARDRKDKAQMDALEKGIDVTGKTITQLEAETSAAQSQLGPARETLEAARGKELRDKALAGVTIADANKELERLQKDREKAQAALTTAGRDAINPFFSGGPGTVSPIEQAHLDKLAKRVNEIDAAIEQQFGVIAGVEGIAAGSTARRETAEGGVRDLEGRITRNRGTIGGLRERQQDLIGERDLIRAQGPAREQMRRASASRTEMAADNAAVEEARRWFDAYKALNDTMAATFQAMIASAGMTKAQIDNEMRKLGEKFDARVSQIESQNRNGGTGAR